MTRKIKAAAGLSLVAGAFGVWIAGAFAAVAAAPMARAELYAMPNGSPSGSPTGSETPVGYVVLSEIPGAYLQSQINASGKISGGEGGSAQSLLLVNGSCADVWNFQFVPHLGEGEGGHPAHVGDLPNVTPASTGTFSATKITNRFVLGTSPMNAWNYSSGTISLVVGQFADSGEPPFPALCGELNCVSGTSCDQTGGVPN